MGLLAVTFQLCEAKELLSYCAGFILKNLAAMMEVKNFRDTLFNNNSNEVTAKAGDWSLACLLCVIVCVTITYCFILVLGRMSV